MGKMQDTEVSTKQRIIDAGTRAIVEKSFNGCGLKEILDAAGVPKGSFYHYFKSKEDFGVALVEESSQSHFEFMRQYLGDRSLSPLERISAYFSAKRDKLAEMGSVRQCLMAKIALEESRLSEPMRAAIKCGYDYFRSMLAQTIREAQAAGEINADHDPERLAGFLTNAWEGAMVRMEIDRSPQTLDDCYEYAMHVLLH